MREVSDEQQQTGSVCVCVCVCVVRRSFHLPLTVAIGVLIFKPCFGKFDLIFFYHGIFCEWMRRCADVERAKEIQLKRKYKWSIYEYVHSDRNNGHILGFFDVGPWALTETDFPLRTIRSHHAKGCILKHFRASLTIFQEAWFRLTQVFKVFLWF